MLRTSSRLIIAAIVAIIIGIVAAGVTGSSIIPGLDTIVGIALGAFAFIVIFTLVGGKLSPLRARNNLMKIGLVNKFGEAPFLLTIRQDNSSENGIILIFENRGIPREVFEDKKAAIEAALNIRIDMILDGNTRRMVHIHAVPAKHNIDEYIAWDGKYLSNEDFVLVLGRSLTGYAKVNLRDIPHMLIGGSTGSGKTILLKNILAQCLAHDASVYIADFKGGVDFPHIWHEKCKLVFDEMPLLRMLEELVGELEARKAELRRTGCANIWDYNENIRHTYRHIIFACDEVAELLDTTGRDKEDKAIIKEITGHLITLARQGRAFGIHLVLGTQRPSVDVIPPQVKSNIDCRICGRADDILSRIILDGTEAADAIPRNSHGRFLMNDGTLFQAFYFDDKEL